MSWRVTYVNRDGVRVAMDFGTDRFRAEEASRTWNKYHKTAARHYGPQAVGTFRAEEDKPTPATDETLADEYRAEALAWRTHATKLEAELTALRQRKGAAPGVARESGRILLLLRRLASADSEARAILQSIEP